MGYIDKDNGKSKSNIHHGAHREHGEKLFIRSRLLINNFYFS
jgi:hypothetical protein